jgi:hypothetical protein
LAAAISVMPHQSIHNFRPWYNSAICITGASPGTNSSGVVGGSHWAYQIGNFVMGAEWTFDGTSLTTTTANGPLSLATLNRNFSDTGYMIDIIKSWGDAARLGEQFQATQDITNSAADLAAAHSDGESSCDRP